MRKSLWILSTPLIAGGLAWGAGTSDGPTSLAQHQQLSPDAQAALLAEADGPTGPPQPYVRRRKPNVSGHSRNYYQALFGAKGDRQNLPPADSSLIRPVAGQQPAGTAAQVIPAKHEQLAGQPVDGQVRQIQHQRQAAAGTSVQQIPTQAPAGRIQPVHASPSQQDPRQTAYRPAPAAPTTTAPVTAAAPQSNFPASPTLSTSTSGAFLSPQISLQWQNQGEIVVGQKYRCQLLVKNTGTSPARDIIIEAAFPGSVRLTSADPLPDTSHNRLQWAFTTLTPGEEKLIVVEMIPARQGEVAASATVRFAGTAATVMKVAEPLLQVAFKGPQTMMVGDVTTQMVVISNPGTGTARDVVLQAVIPAGLEHARGHQIEMGVGTLAPGETREVKLSLAAVAGGEQTLVIQAHGAAGLVKQASCKVLVSAPQLEIQVSGPGLRYVDRPALYQLTVTNKGTATTNNVRVVHQIPEGFTFLKADNGASYDADHRTASWFLGQLNSGESRQLLVELDARQIGNHVHRVQVAGDGGALAEAHTETRVAGTPSLVMEVADINDPVEVHTQTAYEIRIRNEGSKGAQNLTVACELPAGVQLLDTSGPTTHFVEKGYLFFRPVAELAPGKTLQFRVRVQGNTAGTLRFRARLTSNSSTEPVIVEELTKYYGE